MLVNPLYRLLECTRKFISVNTSPMEHLHVLVVTDIKVLNELPGESSVTGSSVTEEISVSSQIGL